MKKLKFTALKMTILTLMAVALLSACSQSNNGVTTRDELAFSNYEINSEINSESIKQLVHDYSVGNIEPQSASITSSQLIVTDASNELVYDLPEDEFFVSIAPYVNETHPCKYHSLTGCQGEMVNEEFEVYIEDAEGNRILDETVTSLDNGFIDLWLPRDKTYNITVMHDGKKAESTFSTYETDGTCITTIQLL